MNSKQNNLAFPAFLIAVGYLIFAGLAGWWPWNVPVPIGSSPLPTLTPAYSETIRPTPPSPATTPSQQYFLQCQERGEDEIFNGQPWYEYLKSRILPGWHMTSVCYNMERNAAVYFRVNFDPDDYPFSKKDKYSQFGVYDVSQDDFIVGPKKALEVYQGCGYAVVWMKINQIHYNCEGGEGGGLITETYSFDLETQTQKLIRRCESEAGLEGYEKKTCVNDPKN